MSRFLQSAALGLTVFLLALVQPQSARSYQFGPNVDPHVVFRCPGEWPDVAVSPDSRYVIAGANQQAIMVWEIATKKLVTKLKPKGGDVYALRFSKDGKTLATLTGSYSGPSYYELWTADNWQPNPKPTQQTKVGLEIRVADWVDDNLSFLAINPTKKPYGKYLGIWDARLKRWAATEIVLAGKEPSVEEVAVAASEIILIGKAKFDAKDNLMVFDRQTAKLKWQIPLGDLWPSDLMVAPDGQSIAIAGSYWGLLKRDDSAPVVTLWDLKTRKQVWLKAPVMGLDVKGLEFTADGKILAAGLENHQGIQLYSVSDGAERRAYNLFPGHWVDFAFSPDNRWLIAGELNGPVVIWDRSKER